MKDSRIRVYGVVALIFYLLFRLLLVSHLFDLSVALAALLIAGSFSRAVLAVIMVQLPSARSDGLSHSVGRPDAAPAYVGVAKSIFLVSFFWASPALLLA